MEQAFPQALLQKPVTIFKPSIPGAMSHVVKADGAKERLVGVLHRSLRAAKAWNDERSASMRRAGFCQLSGYSKSRPTVKRRSKDLSRSLLTTL